MFQYVSVVNDSKLNDILDHDLENSGKEEQCNGHHDNDADVDLDQSHDFSGSEGNNSKRSESVASRASTITLHESQLINGNIDPYEQSKLTLMIMNMAFMTNKQYKVFNMMKNVIGQDFRFQKQKTKMLAGLASDLQKRVKQRAAGQSPAAVKDAEPIIKEAKDEGDRNKES